LFVFGFFHIILAKIIVAIVEAIKVPYKV